ncbi:MAG TPA: HD domain-containing phosphohydrolase [Deltaproteobacteria bacterium]|nr:HD domain-containing phosphohydrolase [Deltaproteobacteria bacterium]
MEASKGSRFDIHVPARMPQSPGVNSEGARRHTDGSEHHLSVLVRLLKPSSLGLLGSGYYSVPSYWMCPGKQSPFGIYRKTSTGEIASILEPDSIYIPGADGTNEPDSVLLRGDSRIRLLSYLDVNLESIIASRLTDPFEKAELFYYFAYRRLRVAYKNPGNITVFGIKQIADILVEQILVDKKIMEQIFLIMRDNIYKTTENPECTIMHSLHVGMLATFFVAKILEHISKNILKDIALCYFFHDIGMMRIPQKIMDSTDPLASDAWSLIRQHPCFGLEIMKEIQGTPSEMTYIIKDHHERLDGNGYPEALKGEGIHFFVKVCSILDAFEAMVSQRTYRRAFSTTEALKIIKQRVPQGYDPVVFSKLAAVFFQ